MPTIDEAVNANKIYQANLAARPAQAEAAAPVSQVAPMPPVSTKVSLLPSRGVFPPGIANNSADSDLNPPSSIQSSVPKIPSNLGTLVIATGTSPATQQASAGTTVAPTAAAGTPKQVTNLVVTEVPTKLNGQMVAVVTATWLPASGDSLYSFAQIWVTGYHSVTGAQLVASGSSPLTFSMDATNETVTFYAVACSASGLKTSTSGAPTASCVLSPTTGTPPAPTVTVPLAAVPTGYQFTFAFDTGILGNIIQCYNVYRNTSNTVVGATLIRTVPQPQTNTGSYVFQDNVGVLTAQTYYYFVSCVDVNGAESAATAAQSGAVSTATTINNVPDGTTKFGETAGSITYRPLTNMLTATDAGSSATINVTSFTMRTVEKGDVVVNTGSITALSYATLYYVYYDDPTVAGGAVAYAATTVKATAINGTGRFYVGSIVTPPATGPNTVGNNDGGAGVQVGSTQIFLFGATANNSVAGATTNNPDYAIDGNLADYAEVIGSTSSTGNYTFTLSAPSPTSAPWSSLVLNIRSAVTANDSDTVIKLAYGTEGGAATNTVYSLTGTTRALTTDSFTLSNSQNLALITVVLSIKRTSSSNAGHALLYEAWIVGLQ